MTGETIYFQCALLCGDNLGLHSILGLVESFLANFCCRVCKIQREFLRVMCEEDPKLLRTIDNYERDLLKGNVSKTGIKERCTWHYVQGFHITKSVALDIMHDVSEGVAMYTIPKIIDYLIFELQVFSLDTLNYRIKNFNYGILEKSNKPPIISVYKSSKTSISLFASEITCFVRYLGLMIGEFVPRGNKVLGLHLKFRKILEILHSTKIHRSDIMLLKSLISEHYSLH